MKKPMTVWRAMMVKPRKWNIIHRCGELRDMSLHLKNSSTANLMEKNVLVIHRRRCLRKSDQAGTSVKAMASVMYSKQ